MLGNILVYSFCLLFLFEICHFLFNILEEQTVERSLFKRLQYIENILLEMYRFAIKWLLLEVFEYLFSIFTSIKTVSYQ